MKNNKWKEYREICHIPVISTIINEVIPKYDSSDISFKQNF